MSQVAMDLGVEEEIIERAAKLLYARDSKRAQMKPTKLVWLRVADEYRAQAGIVIDAFKERL